MAFKLELIECRTCDRQTTKKYARAHEGRCKRCVETVGAEPPRINNNASQEEHQMGPKIGRISISDIRLDFQPSENLIEETVAEYVNQIKQRHALPVIHVRFDGCKYFLQDGFHRIEAAKRCGLRTLKAEITPGTLKDMEAEFDKYVQSLKQRLEGQNRRTYGTRN